ncbi:unnamed protein product [Microthlaspi erraticum]|uniref:ATP citrate synthase n=1 Tax=Microthlaspi erraticum TaxID=1685480 RepID=A0A6D2ISP9_9BRAS|nr:unnamed protein product [Microthlaspi erraticum]
MLDLRVATPQIILNYAQLLEENSYFEDAFKVYERGVKIFKHPHVKDIWVTYLSKFVKRYGNTKMERTRELFENAVASSSDPQLYLEYAKFEEDHGLGKRAMEVYREATRKVADEKKLEVYEIYIARAAERFGVAGTREVYKEAIESSELPEKDVKTMCMRLAELERSIGEVDRARAVFRYASEFADAEVFEKWQQFEVEHGNEDTYRDMLRVKRTVTCSALSSPAPVKPLSDTPPPPPLSDKTPVIKRSRSLSDLLTPKKARIIYAHPVSLSNCLLHHLFLLCISLYLCNLNVLKLYVSLLSLSTFRSEKMARKKIREYDSKRLVKEHFKRLSGRDLPIRSVQINQETDLNELVEKEPWLSSEKLVVKPDMLFGKRGKSGLVALKLDFADVATFVKERLGKEVEMGGCKGPITTFIVEPFVPHDEEFYLNIVSDRLGCSISFSECGGIDIEENWDKVKTISVPTGSSLTAEICAPLVATLPLEIKGELEDFIQVIFTLFEDLDFTFLEMNPFALVDGKPYPLDMRGELDDTAAFKNFKKWGDIEFPMPFGRVMSSTESFIHGLDEKTSASLKFTVLNPKGRIWTMVAGGGASVIYADTVGDLGYASELGNYAEYSGAPKEDEVLQYARVVIDCATANPDGKTRALVIGGGIANFTDVAATFNGIIRALREKEAKLKAARMHIYVRRGGPNYQKGLAKMRSLGDEIGVPIEVYGPEATMTGICKEAIEYITAAA